MSNQAVDIVAHYKGKNITKGTVFSIISRIESSDDIVDAFRQCLNAKFVYDQKLERIVNNAKTNAANLMHGLKCANITMVARALEDISYTLDDIYTLNNNQIEELYDC